MINEPQPCALLLFVRVKDRKCIYSPVVLRVASSLLVVLRILAGILSFNQMVSH
ncbi:hypothetical protein PHET_08473 [Paragonimus heterotremus]|uniref:Uncharacterized protein n=1 Tax=Paragonimus heterotremus TaxID=100268 RepID=A0A8J4T5U4_9TREM|nr:hypothetical protein PHET_08473 [Paragonimus heterotremus]